MADHDQRLKTLLREFFLEFFRLFFPVWAERFDFSRTEWLEQEIFPDPPQGQRRAIDLLAKLPTRQPVSPFRPGESASWIALIHAEVEQADTVAPLRPRMLDYYHFLRRKYGLPVLPIGLYLSVGLDGIGHDVYEERFWDLPILRFEYLYVGLPGLPAETFVAGDNPLGVALSALMRMEEAQKARLRAEALRRILELADNEWRRFLLGEFVQAYLPLNAEQWQEFDRLVTTEPYMSVRQLGTTWYEQGREQGRQQGRQQGREQGREEERRDIAMQLLEQRFGALPKDVNEQLQALPADRLLELLLRLSSAQSLQELGLGK